MSVPDSLVFANAPPANAKDIPATPNSGAARLPRFCLGACFVRDILAVLPYPGPENFRRMDCKISQRKKERQSMSMDCLCRALKLTSVLAI